MAAIEASEIRKIYPNGTVGLDDLSVSIESGELVGVLGSSGAGKTTFFRLLNGTLRPTTGQLAVLGQPMHAQWQSGQLRRLRTHIALVNQHHNVIPPLSVLQNVLIGRLGRVGRLQALAGIFRPSPTDLQLATESLALVGLADKLYSRAEDLSGGQQQRVAIARAMVQGAEMLLADEPIASVDRRNAALLLELFERMNHELGVTVIMNLHQLDFAIRYCPRLLVLQAGRLTYDGPPEGLENFDIYGEQTTAEHEPEEFLLPPASALWQEAEIGELVKRRSKND